MTFNPCKPLDFYLYWKSLLENETGSLMVNGGYASISSRGIICFKRNFRYHSLIGPSWIQLTFDPFTYRTNLFYKETVMGMNVYALFDIDGEEMPFEEWIKDPRVKKAYMTIVIKEVLDEI